MAGTRLFLQSAFVIQSIVLFIAAFYFGLSDDLVALKLFGCRDARFRLAPAADQRIASLATPLTLPAVTIATADSQVSFWTSYLEEFRGAYDNVSVRTHSQLQSVCKYPPRLDAVEHASGADVWICESVPPPADIRVVTRNSSMILYARGLRQRKDDLQRLYPQAEAHLDRVAQVTLHVADRHEMPHWMKAAQQWLQLMVHLPCGRNLRMNVKRFDLTSLAANADDGNQDTSRPGNHSARLVSLKDLPNRLFNVAEKYGMDFHFNLFVPSYVPTLLMNNKDGSVHYSVRRGRLSLSVLPVQISTNKTYVDLIGDALFVPIESFVRECMGIAANAVPIDALDITFPSWYVKLWHQRKLLNYFTDTLTAAIDQRNEILYCPSTTRVSDAIVASWFDAIELIQLSKTHATAGSFEDAMVELDLANDKLHTILNDPDLLDPQDFPLDQYAAVFAPLLFPLLLPMILGLRREYSRYREKVGMVNRKISYC